MAKRQVPDLQKILKRLQKQYFPKCRDLPYICWKYPTRKVSTFCLFGLYEPAQNFIYINWAMSESWVPQYFLEYVVYHELVHHMQDEHPIHGEQAHSSRFFEWEKRFKQYDQARAWEETHIPRMLVAINKYVHRLHGR